MNTQHIDKFLGSVVKGNTDDECWNWIACKDRDGYGRIRINKKLVKSAPRFSYEYYNNCELPRFRYIYHTCQNKSCVNPKHLKQTNETDKATSIKGENHHNSKLMEVQIIEMRNTFDKGDITLKQLASQYNICPTVARHIILRNSWKHII